MRSRLPGDARVEEPEVASDISPADFDAARAALRDRVPVSPVLRLNGAGRRMGELLVKAECLMPTGSFKIRGATYRVSLLSAEERRRGVVAYSTGNHAQAVAKAARDAGVQATIVMSPDVPSAKIEATERWGARVVLAERSSGARRSLAENLAREHGHVLVPPYDDRAVIAGQGSVGLELLDQLPEGGRLNVHLPVGGGGLLAGVAAAMKQRRPSVRVVGVEPDLENDAALSFGAGRLIALPQASSSVADALKVQQLGELTWPLIKRYADDVETVSEAEIVDATLFAFSEFKLVVEPGGAVALAAALRSSSREAGTHVAVLCGGNVRLQDLCALAGADRR